MSDESSNSSATCDCQSCPQDVRILLDGAFEEFLSFLDYHAANYQAQNPHIRILIDLAENLEDQLISSKEWDASIFPTQLIGGLVDQDALWDLSTFIKTSSNLDWTEILPFFRHPSPTFGTDSAPLLIPLDGDLISMYYRRDLFDQFNMTIPRTWEEYNKAAAFFDGQPLGPGGTPLFGSCVSRIDKCGNEYWTSLILASLTQTLGTSSGFFLDPTSLDPLFGLAMEETLRLTRQQFQAGHDQELTGDCLTSNFALNEGTCALTYNWGNQITVQDSAFDIGVAPTPGSPVVLDRDTGNLINCTVALCPYGVYYDDIGMVNQAPYAAFGGWAGGVANKVSQGRKYAAAEFLAYVSNSAQSLSDILPNGRSSFAQPYRYSHVTSSYWMDAGFGRNLASDYTMAVQQVNSENAALELRVSSAGNMRQIIDEEVFDYLLESVNPGIAPEEDSRLRRESTIRMEQRMQDLVTAESRGKEIKLSNSYRESIGFTYVSEVEHRNYINEDFRDAAWGLSGFMCVTAFTLMIWTIRHRNNTVMKAFQPFLLVQSTIGLLILSSSIIPLGFDDSSYSVDSLNITCMLSPWLYIVGFTIFFSSVYSKVRECQKIYKEPHKYDVLLVQPASGMRLCVRLLILNGTILGLWTGVDPLVWQRLEIDGGIVLEDGTVETYGACRGGNPSIGFVVVLYAINIMITLIATLQAFKCRFLVLEYNEVQWLPLSVFPFLEVWVIGGPILPLVSEDPTVTFMVLSMMIVVSTVVGGMAVFAPKDWYIRKYYHSNPEMNKGFPERISSAGIMVLKHPTVENQKHIEDLSHNLEQVEGWNTELEIEIRVMKEKFKELTTSEKFQVRESLLTAAIADADSPEYRDRRRMDEFEQTEMSRSNDEELAAVEQFQQVWKMPDEDEEEENHTEESAAIPKSSSLGSLAQLDDRGVVATSSRIVGVESAPDFNQSGDEKATSSRALAPPPPPPADSSSDTPSYTPEDPLMRLMKMAEGEDAQNDPPVAAQTSTSVEADDGPDDPLMRIAMMGDADEGGNSDHPLARIPNMGDDGNDTQDSVARTAIKSVDKKNQKKETSLDVVARIIAMKLATAGQEEDDNQSRNSNPEDPLARIMSMDEDEAHIRALNMTVPTYQYTDDDDSEEDDNEDTIIRKKDFRDLSSMIREDDLLELEKRAALLAENMKNKLDESNLVDLTQRTDASVDSETGMGYLALANGGHKDVVSHHSRGMNGLDISKISAEDEGDGLFVTMSDSILDSPPRMNGMEGQASGPRTQTSSDSSNHSSAIRAGESSGNDQQKHYPFAGERRDHEDRNAIQFAGEPSQGDVGRRPASSELQKQTIGDEAFRSPTTPQQPPALARSLLVEEEDSPVQNKSYSISDWMAVGGVASALAEWSDSQSTSSYSESIPDSVTSMEATTRASALDTPIAKELDQLVGKMDWDGVKAAAQKYETSAAGKILPPTPSETSPNGVSVLNEKRRKKRELEAWRTSLTKSFHPDG